MWEKIESFWEEEQQSSERKVTPYIPWRLDFKEQEKKDKEEADEILNQITWWNTSKWNYQKTSIKPRINMTTMKPIPRRRITGEMQNIIDYVNIRNHEISYLSQHEKMSESEYNTLFSWKDQLQQWQIWDCYLVSWINELACAQSFDGLIRTSIRRVKRNNWDLWYEIQLPLWKTEWRKILIKKSELNVAKIRWKNCDWYRLLELAYAKNRRPNNAEWNKYSPITGAEFAKIEEWFTPEVLEKFLWKNTIKFNHFWDKKWSTEPLSKLSASKKKQIIWFLKNYSPSIWNQTLSLWSLHKNGKNDNNSYKVWNNILYYKHAYSVTKVNVDKGTWEVKSIRILNPWNTSWPWKKYQDLTIDEFFNAFHCMSYWKIDTSRLLTGKNIV